MSSDGFTSVKAKAQMLCKKAEWEWFDKHDPLSHVELKLPKGMGTLELHINDRSSEQTYAALAWALKTATYNVVRHDDSGEFSLWVNLGEGLGGTTARIEFNVADVVRSLVKDCEAEVRSAADTARDEGLPGIEKQVRADAEQLARQFETAAARIRSLLAKRSPVTDAS